MQLIDTDIFMEGIIILKSFFSANNIREGHRKIERSQGGHELKKVGNHCCR